MSAMYKNSGEKLPLTAEQEQEKRVKTLERQVSSLTEQVRILRQELHNAKRTGRRHAADISSMNEFMRYSRK